MGYLILLLVLSIVIEFSVQGVTGTPRKHKKSSSYHTAEASAFQISHSNYHTAEEDFKAGEPKAADYSYYSNPSRGLFYNKKGIVTHGKRSDNRLVIEEREKFNRYDKILVCAEQCKITFGDFIPLMNFRVPNNDQQKLYVACLIREFFGRKVDKNLKPKKAVSWDFLGEYLYPGNKKIYPKNGIDLKEYSSNFAAFINGCSNYTIGKDDCETIDIIMAKVVAHPKYPFVKHNAFRIRVIRLDYEKRTNKSHTIGLKNLESNESEENQ